ncbi:hypothetical protein OSB04_007212 [Centaurea solstitialis]|uniref:Uncharacterized protein n=1 Tax=Centaurea solstitialis TaxID=347529 RepID=A0AA38WIE3_9ASTR|nr:hypothetical protein OSB04_007212 [Centaurea solstitialis]
MASSSTSTIHKINFMYDVFLSFRGEDTRTNFVDHLYHALKRKSIETYKDDKNLQKGKTISNELIKAIEESRFHVVVFSKNYASSSWCLGELVKIMECQRTHTGHTIYPIFYDVEPTEVRKQSGEFAKAFAKYENDDATEKWRGALIEAANLGGWELKKIANGHEAEFIEIVVKDISSKLPVVSVDENLIGMRTRVNDVVSYLNAVPEEFCMVGIWGMGGSGKTTLARAVFDQIRNEFKGITFVENVREVSNSPLLGLKSLQQQVLRDVLNTQNITVNGVLDGKSMMARKMPQEKVLVVLDDVDNIDQLKALAGEPNWFYPGSKIIITTRDKQVLLAHKVVNSNILNVNLLTDDEAIRLLSKCAFGTESPNPGYEELSERVVRYAAGLPLTITILGWSLYDANEHVWIDTLERLERIPLGETLQKLELSYMGLDTDCKEIFLHIACILKGWKEEEAIKVLESCGFHAIHGLDVLKRKSLITISEHGCLDMHDHIEEMGMYIVRRLHPDEPNKHSRLWIEEEIKYILVNNLGTEATTCILLIPSLRINSETVMKGLGKMERLRFLLVHNPTTTSNWEFDEGNQYFPNSLQYLSWSDYPFCFLPKTFQASNLVVLEMPNSRMEQLWEGEEKKVLHKLRFLHLNHSNLRTLDLRLTPNLEILDLENCNDLVELHMPPLGCPKLKSINLSYAKLSTLDLGLTPNLEILDLKVCYDLVELHMPPLECPKLKSINLYCLKLSTLDLRLVPNIKTLNVKYCANLVEVYMPCECPQLKYLNLSSSDLEFLNLGFSLNIETLNLENCYSLVELNLPRECPKLKFLKLDCKNLMSFNLGPTPNIKALKLQECDYFLELDMFLQCPQLESLELEIPNLSTLVLGPTPNLEILNLQGCDILVELRMHNECFKLETLYLICRPLRTFDFGLTQNLEALTLGGHDDLVELLISIGCPQLSHLKLIGSKLRTLELTLNLKTLILESCDLIELYIRDGDVKLKSLNIRRCSKLKTLDLGQTPNLESLCVEGCSSLVELNAPIGGLKKLVNLEVYMYSMSINICPLHPDNEEYLPSSTENIKKLISDGFHCACSNHQRFLGGICGLQHLKQLTLEGNISEVPKSLDQLQYLEELTLLHTKITHLPDSICRLKHLKSLYLTSCKLLEKLPEDLGRLDCLEMLSLSACIVLRDIPNSICKMKSLKYFSLNCCNRVEELPEELGCLECLEELDITVQLRLQESTVPCSKENFEGDPKNPIHNNRNDPTSSTYFQVPIARTFGDIAFRDKDYNDVVEYYYEGRPDYCGHSGFQVTCQSDQSGLNEYPILNYESVDYRILATDPSKQVITIARDDLWNDVCPQYLHNTTYNHTLFAGDYYSGNSDNVNVSLYYGCDEPSKSSDNIFTCHVNGTNNYGYFNRTNEFDYDILEPECESHIIVPVKKHEAELLPTKNATERDLSRLLGVGFDLYWSANSEDCDQCSKSGGWCGSNQTRLELFVCYCYNGNFSLTCNNRGFLYSIAGIMFLSFGILCWRSRLWMARKAANGQLETFIRDYGTLAPKRYKYSDIKTMTNSFQEELGRGGYGIVYKGLLQEGQPIAVKVLAGSVGEGEDFINEVASISRTSHVNIVTLLGFCIDGKKRALIYKFMPNGSLDKFLRGDDSRLDWNTLFLIAKGIARGLEYLHRGCNTRIVHFDIKPHNILLDRDFVPKISDFGLAKLCKWKESIVSVMGARGTAGYMAPEVFLKSLGGASHKSDVYSYGMMVLEMTGARERNNSCPTSASEAYFPESIYKKVEAGDNLGVYGVANEDEAELARKMVMVSLWCIQSRPSDRPSISKVVEMLEGSLESLQVPPSRFWPSPTRPTQDTSSSAAQSSTISKTLSTVQSIRKESSS